MLWHFSTTENSLPAELSYRQTKSFLHNFCLTKWKKPCERGSFKTASDPASSPGNCFTVGVKLLPHPLWFQRELLGTSPCVQNPFSWNFLLGRSNRGGRSNLIHMVTTNIDFVKIIWFSHEWLWNRQLGVFDVNVWFIDTLHVPMKFYSTSRVDEMLTKMLTLCNNTPLRKLGENL